MSNHTITIGDVQLTQQDIANALEEVDGNLAKAAALLGVRRGKLVTAISRDTDLRELHEDYLERAIDNAQANVFEAVEAKNYQASCFLLSTLGKDRGYSTKSELTLKARVIPLEELTDSELDERREALLKRSNEPKPVSTFDMPTLGYDDQKADTASGAETHTRINKEISGEGYIEKQSPRDKA